MSEGVLGEGRHVPGESLLYGFYNRFGESLPSIGLARAAARYMRGRPSDATRRAGKRAVEPLVDLVQPWALEALQAHRAEGLRIVLATTSPLDLVAPLADALGFDDIIATRYAERGGPVHRAARRRLRLGTGKAGGRGPVGRRPRRRPRGVARLHRQRLRPTAAAGSRAPPPPQRRPPAGGRGPGPTLAPRALGPPARHPFADRPRALPPHSPVLPARGVPLRPFRRQRIGAHPDPRAGAGGLQSPQLLRCRRPRGGRRTIGAPGPLPGQAGGVRRAPGGPPRPIPRRHRRRTGGRLVRAHATGGGGLAGRRSGHRPAPGDHSPRAGVLRSGAPGPHRDGPPGRGDRCPGRARRPVGDRAGLAPIVQGARHDRAAPPAAGDGEGGGAGDPRPGGRGGRHRPSSWRPSPTCCPKRPGCRTSRPTKTWPAPDPRRERIGRRGLLHGAVLARLGGGPWPPDRQPPVPLPGAGQRDGGRRPGRSGPRPLAAGHPGPGPPGGPGHRDQRQDHDHPDAGGCAVRGVGSDGGVQRDRGQHARWPRGRPGRCPGGGGHRAGGRRGVPRSAHRGDRPSGGGPVEPLP